MLGLFRSQKEQFYKELYRHGVKLETWIRKNSGTREDAEDILQEAVIICRKYYLDHPNNHHNSGALLMGIGQRLWLQTLRNRKYRHQIHPEDMQFDSNLDELIEKEARFQKLEKTLDQLGQKCKQLLVMYYFKKNSMEEIAQSLGLSNQAVAKSTKYKCLEKAREMIKNG